MPLNKNYRIKWYKKKFRKLVIYLYYSCRLHGLALHRKWVFSYRMPLILTMLLLLLYASGIYQYFIATSFEKHYIHWGPNVTLEPLFEQLQSKQVPSIMPVSAYNHPYIYLHMDKCVLIDSEATISIVFVVKSSIDNFQRRDVIRKTWGQETRFHHVVVRTVFLLGMRPGTPHLQERISPTRVNQLPVKLYAGYVFQNSAPIRWIMSKWYVSLEEYPYSRWAPYVTAGAYILSRHNLERLYVASLYTFYFRFDDIFLGMASKKARLSLLHNKEFYFSRKPHSIENYKWVIASHEWGDPSELYSMWTEQIAHDYA